MGDACACAGDLVDVAIWGNVSCVSKIDTLDLGLGWGGGGSEGMCTMHAGVMLCIVFVTMLPDMADDSSTSTTCLYLSPSQLCLIERESIFKHTHAHAEQDRVMRIGLRTHIGSS